MKLVLGRLFSALFIAGGWLLAGARTILDLVGYSTVPEDVGVAQARLDQFLGWLLSVPWWAVWGVAFVSTLWLIWVSWPRQQEPISVPAARASSAIDTAARANHSVSPVTVDADAAQTKEQEDTAIALMTFFWDFIGPAARAQWQLQTAMIKTLHGNDTLIDFAVGGLTARAPAVALFWRSFSRLDEAFCSSPVEILPLDEVISHMRMMEVHYQYFRDQVNEIAQKTGINYRKEHLAEWEKWRTAHNALKTAYDEQIRRSKRFGPLFRPARESLWGDIIGPATP